MGVSNILHVVLVIQSIDSQMILILSIPKVHSLFYFVIKRDPDFISNYIHVLVNI